MLSTKRSRKRLRLLSQNHRRLRKRRLKMVPRVFRPSVAKGSRKVLETMVFSMLASTLKSLRLPLGKT